MKKILLAILLLLSIVVITSCSKNDDDNNQTNDEPVTLAAPVITLTNNVVSWTQVNNATGYIVSKNNTELDVIQQTSYTITDTEVGDYMIKVKAVGDNENYLDSNYSNSVTYKVEKPQEDTPTLTNTTVYVVGDSTVSSFNDNYFYPRYGYGTQLLNYLDSQYVTVNNLALSGRSSRSFLKEANYNTLKSSIQSGDYLIIGFGHNDEKAELDRYSNPNLSYMDSTRMLGNTELESEVSFQYVLYNYYVKLALDKGATPILCTPIVRYNDTNNYDGSSSHVTTDATAEGIVYPGGDYSQAIKTLGSQTNTTVIDLTTITKEEYIELGSEARYFHAMTSGKYNDDKTEIIGNLDSLDKTHTNIYGAKNNAYNICKALLETDNTLKYYVKSDIVKPTKENDLVSNPNYVIPTYSEFTDADKSLNWTSVTAPWYGSVFGDCGGASKITTFTVAQNGNSFTVGNTTNAGKIGSSEGIAMIFQQVLATKNIEFEATVRLTNFVANNNQTGFGLMIRDDIYIDTYDASILSNYCAAGMYVSGSGQTFNALYSRVNGILTPSGNKLVQPQQNEVINLKITKVNSTVTVYYNNLEQAYYDFDLQAIDNKYFYVGMYATRGTVATFEDVVLTITGDSTQA